MPLVEHYHQDGIVSGDVRQPLQLPPPRRGRRGALRHQSRAVYRGGNHHEPHKLNNLIRPKFNYCPPQRISFFRSAPGMPVIAAPRTGAAHLSSLCRQRGPVLHATGHGQCISGTLQRPHSGIRPAPHGQIFWRAIRRAIVSDSIVGGGRG